MRRCIANLHAEEVLADPKVDGAREALVRIRQWLQRELPTVAITLVHHIPCWTTTVTPGNSFTMGPVTFRTTNDWIDWIDFQPAVYTLGAADAQDANNNWRKLLKDALAHGNANQRKSPPGLAGYFDRAFAQCPAVATVTVSGYEGSLSKKVAHAVCQSALDCIGLALGHPHVFVYQTLGSTRSEPFQWTSIVGTSSGLGLPGYQATRRVPRLDAEQARSRLTKQSPLLQQEAAMLQSLLDPTSHAHPELANRWLTALQWLADGHREQDDAIAVAKLGSSLDTLAAGGKAPGITAMLENLLGISKTDPLVDGPAGIQSLGEVVTDIYNFGRSQILHGTHYRRLKRFEELRELALLVIPAALAEAATRLASYSGPGADKAFRSIPPPKP